MSSKFDLNRFDKVNCPAKNWLHNHIYNYLYIRKIISSAMIISGPAVSRHLEDAFKVASVKQAEVYLVEKFAHVYKEMVRRWNIIQKEAHPKWPKDWQKKVHLVHSDVRTYQDVIGKRYACRFEDLDLCQNMESIRYLVGDRIQEQTRIGGPGRKKKKCMLITSSLRGCGYEKTIKLLRDLLLSIPLAEIDPFIPTKARKLSNGVKQYFPTIRDKGRLLPKGLSFFTYRDRSPMMTIMILFR